MSKKRKMSRRYDHLHDLELLDLFIEGTFRGDLGKKEERAVLRELQERGVYIEIGGKEGDDCPICAMEVLGSPGPHVLH